MSHWIIEREANQNEKGIQNKSLITKEKSKIMGKKPPKNKTNYGSGKN